MYQCRPSNGYKQPKKRWENTIENEHWTEVETPMNFMSLTWYTLYDIYVIATISCWKRCLFVLT